VALQQTCSLLCAKKAPSLEKYKVDGDARFIESRFAFVHDCLPTPQLINNLPVPQEFGTWSLLLYRNTRFSGRASLAARYLNSGGKDAISVTCRPCGTSTFSCRFAPIANDVRTCRNTYRKLLGTAPTLAWVHTQNNSNVGECGGFRDNLCRPCLPGSLFLFPFSLFPFPFPPSRPILSAGKDKRLPDSLAGANPILGGET
jgi:hypothetical protein